jgi:outer membrane protein OmpA-like peptidoglycan-associated protein
MRCNPWRWIWGLIPIAGLAWVAVQVEHARIERDLATRGRQELARLGLGWADLSFSGRDGTLSGQAIEESETGRAHAIALRTWGVRSVIDNSGLIDKVDRYEWTALRRDNRVRLNGLVPNEKTRRDVIGIVKASFPNLEIEDRLRLARGAPPTDTWLGGVGFGIKQLAQLRNGQVDLEATSLSVSGEAIDAQAYRAVKSALARGMPPGIRLKLDRVTAPVVKPFLWSARLMGDRLALAGHVPGEQAREDIVSAARGSNARLRINDEMHAAEGAPEGWLEAALAVVRSLAGLEEGAAEMRDAMLTFTGQAATEAKAQSARDALQKLPAAFKVSEQVHAREPALPIVTPFTTSVVLEGGVLTLAGHVPAEEARQALLAVVRQRLPGVPLGDGMKLGAGAPAGWQKCAEAGVAALARVGNGRTSLVDGKLEIAVNTAAKDLAQSLPTQVQSDAAGGCETHVRVILLTPPEPVLMWSAQRHESELVLGGHVPGEAARENILGAARQLFAGLEIKDQMTVSQETSEKWTRAAREGLVQLSRLQRGELTLADRAMTLEGEAAEEAVQSAVRTALAHNMPEGYSARETIGVRPAPPQPRIELQQPTAAISPRIITPEQAKRREEADTCQRLLQTVVHSGTILFDRNSARLSPASFSTLQRLADVANNCAGVRLEIAGFTDADGSAEHNQLLSERRAEAIAEFLADAGVGRDRLKAVGYGETQPLAPNDTQRNKAQNRRIEFSVKTD